MLKKILVIAGLVLFAFALLGFAPFDSLGVVKEAAAGGVCLAVAMLL